MAQSDGTIQVLSQIPGRIRVHLTGWNGTEVKWLEEELRNQSGIKEVHASRITGNLLICYERQALGSNQILGMLQEVWHSRLERVEKSARNPGPITPSYLVRAATRGVLGHLVFDTLWFTAGFAAQSAGVPQAGLAGPLHVLADVVIWSYAFLSARTKGPKTGRPDQTVGSASFQLRAT